MANPAPIWQLPLMHLCITVALLCLPTTAHTAVDVPILSKENKLKAAYLLNFTKYIEWHSASPIEEQQPLYICLQDSTPFEAFLQGLISSRAAVPGKRLVKALPLSSAETCDLTYLHSTVAHLTPPANNSVIVIDSEKVTNPASAITFYIDNRKLRFEIDVDSVQEVDVSISSELLKLARIK